MLFEYTTSVSLPETPGSGEKLFMGITIGCNLRNVKHSILFITLMDSVFKMIKINVLKQMDTHLFV